MTPEDLAASTQFPEQGYWSYDFAHPDMPAGDVAFLGLREGLSAMTQ